VVQCVAVRCSVLQCVAVCCSVLQCVWERKDWHAYRGIGLSVLQCVAVWCSVLLCVAVCCSVCVWEREKTYTRIRVLAAVPAVEVAMQCEVRGCWHDLLLMCVTWGHDSFTLVTWLFHLYHMRRHAVRGSWLLTWLITYMCVTWGHD